MARRKKKKKNPRKSFSFGAGNTRRPKKKHPANRRGIPPAFMIICIIAALVILFVFLNKYVKKHNLSANARPLLELVMAPEWINEPLKEMIYEAATADTLQLSIDDGTARAVQKNLEENFFWIDDIQVRVTGRTIRIKGRWREPLALIRRGMQRYYIDEELMTLNYVPIDGLAIIKIEGFLLTTRLAGPGVLMANEDIASAVEVLSLLRQMDRKVTPDKPLLSEIERIDISNFKGREYKSRPHIVLYTTDNTEIIWGAEVGAWQRNLESTDEQKIAKLYEYYQKIGSLLKGVKYINLRDPQGNIPQPIDKY